MTTAPRFTRILAADVNVGDRVARTRTATFREVHAIGVGPVSVRFHYANGGTDRPAQTAKWWREDAPADVYKTAAEVDVADQARDDEALERDFPGDEELGYHGRDEVPAGHPDELDYQGTDQYGGQPCPHNPHWRHCRACNPSGDR